MFARGVKNLDINQQKQIRASDSSKSKKDWTSGMNKYKIESLVLTILNLGFFFY